MTLKHPQVRKGPMWGSGINIRAYLVRMGSSFNGKRSCTIKSPMENRSSKMIWCGYTPQQSVAVNQGSCIGLGRDHTVSLNASLRQYTASTIGSNVVNDWWSISTGSSLAHRGFAYKWNNLHHGSLFPKQYIHHIWEPTLSYWTLTLLRLHQIQEEETVHLYKLRFHPPPDTIHRHHNIHDVIAQLHSVCYQW